MRSAGFRRITWFLDRPDVMARYTAVIHADKSKYPVLLSNGNLLEKADEPGGRHRARFDDPFPKPSYLSRWSRRTWTCWRTSSSR